MTQADEFNELWTMDYRQLAKQIAHTNAAAPRIAESARAILSARMALENHLLVLESRQATAAANAAARAASESAVALKESAAAATEATKAMAESAAAAKDLTAEQAKTTNWIRRTFIVYLAMLGIQIVQVCMNATSQAGQ